MAIYNLSLNLRLIGERIDSSYVLEYYIERNQLICRRLLKISCWNNWENWESFKKIPYIRTCNIYLCSPNYAAHSVWADHKGRDKRQLNPKARGKKNDTHHGRMTYADTINKCLNHNKTLNPTDEAIKNLWNNENKSKEIQINCDWLELGGRDRKKGGRHAKTQRIKQ